MFRGHRRRRYIPISDEKTFWANAYLSHARNPECRDAAAAADNALACYKLRFPVEPDPEEEPTPNDLKEEIVDRFIKLGVPEESARSFADYAQTIVTLAPMRAKDSQ